MQGISKGRHVHMMDALLRLEELMVYEQAECSCLEQAKEYHRELQTMHKNYERLLDQLAEQISAYEDLFGHVKVQFLGRKLKALKKGLPAERAASLPSLAMLHHNIQLAYGT